MLGKRKSYYVENGIIHFAFEYGKFRGSDR